MTKEALKLALEALEESIDTVRHNYEADWRHGYPTRKAQLNSMKQGVEDHEHAITAIKEALAQPPLPAQKPVECLDCGSHNVGIPATYDSLINSVKALNT